MLGRCWSVTCCGRGNIWWSWSVTFHGRCIPANHTPKSTPRVRARNFRSYLFSWYTNVRTSEVFQTKLLLTTWVLAMADGQRYTDVWKKLQNGVGYYIHWGGAKFGAWGIVLVSSQFSPRPRAPYFSAARKSGESWSCQRQMYRSWTWNSSALDRKENKQGETKKRYDRLISFVV